MYSSKSDAIARLGPLHYAVLTRDCDAIDKQLRRGVDVTARNQDGDTALHLLCYPRKRISAREFSLTLDKWRAECNELDRKVIRRLAASDRRCFHAQDADGNTPLMKFTTLITGAGSKFHEFFALVELEFAISGRIKLDILNNDGESALDLAFSTGLDHLIEAIRVHQKRSPVSITLLLFIVECIMI